MSWFIKIVIQKLIKLDNNRIENRFLCHNGNDYYWNFVNFNTTIGLLE